MFYANLKYEDMTIISEVNNTTIVFSLEEFGTLCILPAFERTYTINARDNFLNLYFSIKI